MVDRRWPAWVAALAAVVVGWFAIRAQDPPSPLPAHAAAGRFAAARAQKHVEAIARAPHPMGSPESARVRETIIRVLKEIGLEPEVQSARLKDRPAPENIVARMKGQGPAGKKTLMLCAHYDSVHEGPGASDNAAGVAVVLETLRALKAGQPLKRDVIALFTDGEEYGLLGAQLFVNEHPWAPEIGLALNFDARGNSGPSILFETSDSNGWLINQYAQAVPQPLATSVSMDVYKIMPNNSDMTIFKNAGMGGLNFAFGAGLAYYHTPEDTPENLDQSTLQHQGDNALAAARHFGKLNLDQPRHDDVIYASVLNRAVLSYPKAWAPATAVITLVVFLGVVFYFHRTGEIDLGGLVSGTVLFACEVIAALLAVGLLCLLGLCFSLVRNVLQTPSFPWLKHDVWIMTAFALVAVTLTVACTRWSAGSRQLKGLIMGALAWWMALALATAIWVPGASYLFVWPTLGSLLGLIVASRCPPGSSLESAANLVGSTPALLLVAPLIRTTFDGLSLPMTAPIVVFVVLFSGVSMPLWGPLVQPKTERALTLTHEDSAQHEMALEHAS